MPQISIIVGVATVAVVVAVLLAIIFFKRNQLKEEKKPNTDPVGPHLRVTLKFCRMGVIG